MKTASSRAALRELYKPADLVDRPIYPLAQVAQYTGIPAVTVRSWVAGRDYATSKGDRYWPHVIKPADDAKGDFLSFTNLVEVYVLGALRKLHQVPMPRIRQAIWDLSDKFGDRHPLANRKMRIDGSRHLYLDEIGTLLKLDGSGQLAMREVMEPHLRRIVHENQYAIRLFPWAYEKPDIDSPMPVAIDPRVAFGKPFLVKSGVPTAAVADRFDAGELIAELAEDFKETPESIEQAVKLGQRRAA
jgi:uncharacterized protein (DUF433 family)